MRRRLSTLGTAGQRLPRLPRGLLIALFFAWLATCAAPGAGGQSALSAVVAGKVVDLDGKPVSGARVTLHGSATKDPTAESNASGAFSFPAPQQAGSSVSVETKDHRYGQQTVAHAGVPLRIVVKPPTSANPTMEFVDKPDFTVAGVTDWTAVGGHGSDATLRTSEEMARRTAALKNPDAPGSVAAPGKASGPLSVGPQDRGAQAEAHRLAGERDESLGDPLAAAREEEQAATLDPSEQNYFTWGSELLLHRAIWQAAEVFGRGARLHPQSQRLSTGLGSALFAGAKYEEAATHLCAAVDLDPANRETYLFLGKLGLASPISAACVSERIARFAQMHPDDADALYYEAMLLLKEPPASSSESAADLLRKAVALNPKFAEAYLQLGILALARHDNASAQTDFERAISADPSQAEAHYRLGVVYDRKGHPEQARAEFARHETLVKEQAEAVERERRQVKQFLVVLGGSATPNPSP